LIGGCCGAPWRGREASWRRCGSWGPSFRNSFGSWRTRARRRRKSSTLSIPGSGTRSTTRRCQV
jgi:hypothetical protein